MLDIWKYWDKEVCHKMTDCELEGQEGWNNWKGYNGCEDYVDGIIANWNDEKFGKPTPEEFIALINKTMEEEDLDWEQIVKKFTVDD